MIKLLNAEGFQIYFNVFNIVSVEDYGDHIIVKHRSGTTKIKEPIDLVVSKIEKALIAMAGGFNVQNPNQ
tara:strand:- start:2690 stop:2899 length:210 start_codon:yes stop_codon:yes gene_type:complete